MHIPLRERIFELIDGVLYVTEKALTESGLSVNYYRKEKSTGNKRLKFLDHPDDLRFNLIAYETLSEAHKEKIIARYKDPYDFVARDPILRMVSQNSTARQFFLDYQYNGKKLPIRRINQYTRAAEWLDLLVQVEESRNKIIKSLGLSVPRFFDHLKGIMQTEKINGESETYNGRFQLPADFPATYQNLQRKREEYKRSGCKALVSKVERMAGNQIAAKVFDKIAESQLLTLIEDGHQYDDVLVAFMYNIWAGQNGYPAITPATVGVWRRKRASEITIGRYGNEAMNEKYIRQVKGLKPTCPLFLVEHDDNNLDFLFQDKDGYQFNKYVAITVKDSHCNLLLGKSYVLGQNPLQEQVHHAYIDAMYYIRSLTGGWHMPHEFKADNWASKSLRPLYDKIGKFLPPSHANKHRGYIEQSFGNPLWKRAQKLVSQDNWSGNNMTAKYRGVNPDMLNRSLKEKSRPMVGNDAELIIEKFFYLLRYMPDIKRSNMNAPSKEEQWLEAWNSMHKDDKLPISDEDFLIKFGIRHEPQGRTISITNRGVEPRISGQKLSYDLPESWMYDKYIGAKVNVVYDPFDMSRVLVTNYDDIRFIAKTALLQPRAVKDQYTGSRTYLNAILAEKKDQVRRASEATEQRRKIVDTSYYNAEAMLQGGVIIKGLKNEAEQRFLESNNNISSLDDMIDQM